MRSESPNQAVYNLLLVALVGLIVVGAAGAALAFLLRPTTYCITVADPESAVEDLRALRAGVQSFAVAHEGRLPRDLDELLDGDDAGRSHLPGYTSVPLDPWNNPFHYERDPNGRDFAIICFGEDGQPGGRGDSADLEFSSRAQH